MNFYNVLSLQNYVTTDVKINIDIKRSPPPKDTLPFKMYICLIIKLCCTANSSFLLRHVSRRPKDFKLFYAYDYPKILKFSEITKNNLITKFVLQFLKLISRNIHWEFYNYKMICVSNEYLGSCPTDKH